MWQGVETTARTSALIALCLLSQPQYHNRPRQELKDALPVGWSIEKSLSELEKLPFMASGIPRLLRKCS
jgi:hypothetical protein